MREQEDEKLARQLYTQNNYHQMEEELFNSDLSKCLLDPIRKLNNKIGDEELARRLQEQYGGYAEQHMQEKEAPEHSPEESKFLELYRGSRSDDRFFSRRRPSASITRRI
jgi:hypothetical protein